LENPSVQDLNVIIETLELLNDGSTSVQQTSCTGDEQTSSKTDLQGYEWKIIMVFKTINDTVEALELLDDGSTSLQMNKHLLFRLSSTTLRRRRQRSRHVPSCCGLRMIRSFNLHSMRLFVPEINSARFLTHSTTESPIVRKCRHPRLHTRFSPAFSRCAGARNKTFGPAPASTPTTLCKIRTSHGRNGQQTSLLEEGREDYSQPTALNDTENHHARGKPASQRGAPHAARRLYEVWNGVFCGRPPKDTESYPVRREESVCLSGTRNKPIFHAVRRRHSTVHRFTPFSTEFAGRVSCLSVSVEKRTNFSHWDE
jgi:hypothetical protein